MTDHKKHPDKDKHCEEPDFTTQDDGVGSDDGESGGGGTKNPPPPGK